MPDDEKEIPEGSIEVSKPVLKEGTVQFFNKAGFKNPAPRKYIIVLDTVMYSCVGFIGLVSGSTMFTGNQSKFISFILSVVIIVCGSVKKATGVEAKN